MSKLSKEDILILNDEIRVSEARCKLEKDQEVKKNIKNFRLKLKRILKEYE